MKVLLNTARVGPYCNDSAGDVVDVDEAEGRRLIESGQAEPVSAHEAVVETTTAAAPARAERAMGRQPRPQRSKNNVST